MSAARKSSNVSLELRLYEDHAICDLLKESLIAHSKSSLSDSAKWNGEERTFSLDQNDRKGEMIVSRIEQNVQKRDFLISLQGKIIFIQYSGTITRTENGTLSYSIRRLFSETTQN